MRFCSKWVAWQAGSESEPRVCGSPMAPFSEMVPGNYHSIRECNIQFEEIVFIRVSQIVPDFSRVVECRVLSGAVWCCKVLSDCPDDGSACPVFPSIANCKSRSKGQYKDRLWGLEKSTEIIFSLCKSAWLLENALSITINSVLEMSIAQ